MSWIHDDEEIKDWEKSIQFKLVHKRRKDKIKNIRKALNIKAKESKEPPVCRVCLRRFNTPFELSHHIKCIHPNYRKVEEPPVTTSSLLDTFGSKREAASSYYSEAATSNFSLSVPENRFQISGPDQSEAETYESGSENPVNPPIQEQSASNLLPLGAVKSGSESNHTSDNEHENEPSPYQNPPRHSFRDPSPHQHSSQLSSHHSSSHDRLYQNVHIKISPATDPYSVGSPDEMSAMLTKEDGENLDPEQSSEQQDTEKFVEPIRIDTFPSKKKYIPRFPNGSVESKPAPSFRRRQSLRAMKDPSLEETYIDLKDPSDEPTFRRRQSLRSRDRPFDIELEDRLEIPEIARLRSGGSRSNDDLSDEFTCNLDTIIHNDYHKKEVEKEIASTRSTFTPPRKFTFIAQESLPRWNSGGGADSSEGTEDAKAEVRTAVRMRRSSTDQDFYGPNRGSGRFARTGLLYEKQKEEKPEPVEKSCFPQNMGLCARMYHIFDKSDTWAGQFVAVIVMGFIFVSGIAMCLETLPENRYPNYGTKEDDTADIFKEIDVVCVAIFTVEYLIRFFSAGYVTWEDLEAYKPPKDSTNCCSEVANKRLAFFWKPLNFIDFLAIIPFYLEFITETSGLGGSFTVLRLLRILRILRLFKLAKYVKTLRLYGMVAAEVAKPMFLLLFFVLLCCLLGATFMYIVEKGKYDEELGYYKRFNERLNIYEKSPFESVPTSMWWAIATYTTVGYGEMVPATSVGMLIGGFYIILGVIAFSMPISLMSTAYTDVTERMMSEVNVYNKIQTSTAIVAKLRYGIAYLDELEGYLKRLRAKQIDRMECAIERKKFFNARKNFFKQNTMVTDRKNSLLKLHGFSEEDQLKLSGLLENIKEGKEEDQRVTHKEDVVITDAETLANLIRNRKEKTRI